jgi:hypothetical protein
MEHRRSSPLDLDGSEANSGFLSVAFSPDDSSLIAVHFRGAVRIWEVPSAGLSRVSNPHPLAEASPP